MTLLLKCPGCGKRVTYTAAQLGAVTVCPACGSAVELPAPGGEPHSPVPAAETVVPGNGNSVPASPVTPTQEVLSFDVPDAPDVPPKGSSRWMTVVAAVAVLLVLVQAGAMLWMRYRPRPNWQRDHREQILSLKTDAERALAQGQAEAAYAKFRQLDRLVAGNTIDDIGLKQALADAAQSEDDAFRQMLAIAQAKPPIVQRMVVYLPATLPATEPAVVVQAPPAPIVPPPHPHHPPVKDLDDTAPIRPLVRPGGLPIVSDEEIGRAIQGGADYLRKRFDHGRFHNDTPYSDDGVDALAVYALLQADQALHDSRLDTRNAFMAQNLDALKRMEMNDGQATYARSLRANALSLAARKDDVDALKSDLKWLLHAGKSGAYTYVNRAAGPSEPGMSTDDLWDSSNSQYGLLGVWAAAEAGLDVPESYWQITQQHWVNIQLGDGEWGYEAGSNQGRLSMTLAGLASLFVTQDYLNTAPPLNIVARDPFLPALAKGLSWLERGDRSVEVLHNSPYPGYVLYGLERVGLASGFKFFGDHDWYRELATTVISRVRPDGGWNDPVNTSFILLFLARGRHPIVMNKLRFSKPDGAPAYWANRPRDVANLARYASKTLERPVNWQVVPLERDWRDWTDSSILYLASHEPPPLTAADEEKLKQFVLDGGLLFTQADGGSPSFNDWVEKLGTRLFPNYAWTDLPADHPMFTGALRLKERPKVRAISNGARLLMVHLPQDLTHKWESHAMLSNKDSLDFGLDLFLYSAGKTDQRNRLETNVIPDTQGDPGGSITMAEVNAAPDSDPEPDAWPRFARWFRRKTNLQVKLTSLDLDHLTLDAAPIAHLTGVAKWTPTAAQVAALRLYVQSGGVLLIDPCGGPNPFMDTVRKDLLPQALPRVDAVDLAPSHPLLTPSGDGMSNISSLEVRGYVRTLTLPNGRGLQMLRAGKGCIVVCALDVTSGLLGTRTEGIAGYTSEFSMNLAKNFVLWAWDGAKDQ